MSVFSTNFQGIRRSIALVQLPPTIPDWFRQFLLLYYMPLAQQANLMNNAIQAFTVSVAGGAGSTAIVLPAPHPDTNYSMSCTPDWNTTVYHSAVTKTGFTANYGTVAPGGGGTLYCVLVG